MDTGRLLRIGLIAGLFGAAVEMVPVLPIQMALGNSPMVMFQGIAAGALGKAAFAGGAGTALLGVFFHILISVVAAIGFVFFAQQRRWLIARPFWGGMALGLAAYLVMTFIVLPLSHIGFRLPPNPAIWLVSFSIHLFAFGWPIAWLASRLMRRMPVS